MAMPGNTCSRTDTGANIGTDSLSSESLFGIPAGCLGTDFLPFVDGTLPTLSGKYEPGTCGISRERKIPLSRSAYLDHVEDGIVKSDKFITSQDTSFEENCKSPKSFNFEQSTYFLSSNHLKSSGAENIKEGIPCTDDVNWSSPTFIDPLNCLVGDSGGTQVVRGQYYSRTNGTGTTKLDAAGIKGKGATVASAGKMPLTELPDNSNYRASSTKVPHDTAQKVPLFHPDDEFPTESEVKESMHSFWQDSFSSEADCSAGKSNLDDPSFVRPGFAIDCCKTKVHLVKADQNNSTDTKQDPVSLSSASSRMAAEKQKSSKPEPFFDPRRIFASPSMPSQRRHHLNPTNLESKSTDCTRNTENKKTPGSVEEKASSFSQNNGTLLNNDKSHVQSHSCHSLDRSQFIKNDLSDTKKHTNVHPKHEAQAPHDHNDEQELNSNASTIHHNLGREIGSEIPTLRKVENTLAENCGVGDDMQNGRNSRKLFMYLSKINTEKIFVFAVWTLYETSFIVFNIMKLLLGVIFHEIFSISYHFGRIIWLGLAWFCKGLKKVFSKGQDETTREKRNQQWYRAHGNHVRSNHFLSENITLPESGDEAIQRLFSCEGKDPYSILGLKVSCTDEEIRKYYRRQAVLVHPDKNREPGAEEAFKILNHAFELIGEPEKRQAYDAQATFEQDENIAMQQFTDLLTKLHETMQESMKYMGCSGCGGKHKRIPVDIPAREARYCAQCDQHHSAREGDVWAESTRFGFLWHYYACMEGDIYDVTEWASCQHEKFRHVPANSHFVKIHISTGRNRQQRAARDAESELKDFINSMYGAAGGSSDAAGQFGRSAYPPEGSSTGSKQAGSKRRHRRRR